MATNPQITDPTLVAVLETAAQVRDRCAQILSLLHDLPASAPAAAAPPQDPAAVWAAQRALAAQLAQLRGRNRAAVHGVRATKARTAEARHEVDGLHLQLQNLYYEQRHLRGEIAGCEGYDHKYLRLPMIPVEEFLQRYPGHAESSAHDLTIARIEDEHAARGLLEEERVRLLQRKDALVKETSQKKDELARLDAEVEKWMTAQHGVAKIFEGRERRMAEAKQRGETDTDTEAT